MKAYFARTGLLVIGLAALTFGRAAAVNDDKASGEIIVINITGDGPNAKYIRDGDTQEKPVVVNVGQTVKWVNNGDLQHSATSFTQNQSGHPIFDTNLIDPMQSKEIKFDSKLFTSAGATAGGQVQLTYFCTKHPGLMKNGKIVLSDTRKK
jgi:plastocyanin